MPQSSQVAAPRRASARNGRPTSVSISIYSVLASIPQCSVSTGIRSDRLFDLFRLILELRIDLISRLGEALIKVLPQHLLTLE